MTSASFHLARNVLANIVQLIILVKGPGMTGKQYFSMRAFTLSGPGDLFGGKDATARLTVPPQPLLSLN